MEKNLTNMSLKNQNLRFAKELTKINKQLEEILTILNETRKIADSNSKIVTKIIANAGDKIYYNNDFERQSIAQFRDIEKTPEYKQNYLNLIAGLDPNDIATLNQIIARQRKVINSPLGSNIDLYTEDEQHSIRKLKTEFSPNILKITDDLYCYRNYKLPINHFEISVFWDKHGTQKLSRESLEKIRQKNIIDVGGFIGDSILIFAELTDKKIYTFEPNSQNYKLLTQSISLNNLNKTVIPENIALGASPQKVLLYLSGSCSGIQKHPTAKSTGTEIVNMTTLDQYVNDNALDVGLIKVDIEGAEQDFLKGAQKTICNQKPILLISIYHNADDFFHIKPLIESWNLGYKFSIHKPIDYSISREILLICE